VNKYCLINIQHIKRVNKNTAKHFNQASTYQLLFYMDKLGEKANKSERTPEKYEESMIGNLILLVIQYINYNIN